MITKAIRSPIAPGVSSALAPGGAATNLLFYVPLRSTLVPVKSIGGATFARALAAYYYDSAADLLVEALTGVPRFETSYLNEPGRQNLAKDSQDFNIAGANWAEVGTTSYSGDSDAAPDDTTTADTLGDNDGAASAHFIQNIAMTDTLSYVFSVYVKMVATPTRYPMIALKDSAAKETALILDPSTNPSGVYYKELAGSTSPDWVEWKEENGYRRYMFGFTASGTGAGDYKLYPTINADYSTGASVAATGTHVFWGADLQAGKFSTSYIKNTATAQTRPLDSLTYPVASNLPVNDCSGAFDFTPIASANELGNNVLLGSRTDASNYLWLVVTDGGTLIWRKRILATNYDAFISFPYVAGVTYRIAWRMCSVAGMDVWLDGVKGSNNANTTDAVLNTDFGIGTDNVGVNASGGHFERFKIWGNAPLDAIMALR